MQEEMLAAMAEGELGMAKYLWKILTQIDETADFTTEEIKNFQKRIDDFIRDYQIKDGKDGKDGEDGKDGKDGRDGKDGKDGKDGEDGKDGVDGLDGRKGEQGEAGKMPQHQWDGTKIRFQTPDGWGEWVDLRGPVGPAGMAAGPSEGIRGLERVRGTGFERQGVMDIFFGNNLTLTRTANGVRVDAAAGGGSGSGIDTETPVGAVDDSNTSFEVSNTPLYIVVNGAIYYEGVGLFQSFVGTTITLSSPVGTGGFIRSVYAT